MPVSPARKAAITLLDQVLIQGRPLRETNLFAPLTGAERARAMRLAAETLRGLERADRLLAPHLRKTPAVPVHNILRLGAYELAMGSAAHGVVGDLVEIASMRKVTASSKGLVNAVLRKLVETAPMGWTKGRFPRMNSWLRAPLIEAWGSQAVANMERVHFEGALLDITVKNDPATWADRLGGVLMPTGSVRLKEAGQVTALPGYDSGEWWVQDMAASLPVQLLGDVAGAEVLDICAAPGGKTMQLAARGAHVTALDISEARLVRLRENLARTKLEARIVAGDALEHEGRYDAVLLDAPCSATGTIRRHPDLPHIHQGERIDELITLQGEMLRHAVGLLKPGGKLVFATCSLLPDEGECHMDALRETHPDMQIMTPDLPWIDPLWHSSEGGLRLRPDFLAAQGGMDGFYMALLKAKSHGSA